MTPTVVLIPGLMNDGAAWAGQIPALSRRAPIFIAHNEGHDSLAHMAERVLAATAGPLFVAGHSMGGRVALEIVAQVPERVSRLALLSTGAHGRGPDEAAGRMKLVDLAHARGMDAVADAWLPDMMARAAAEPDRQAVRAMLRRSSPAAFAAQQKALLGREDRSGMLPTIACPTLFATGEHDGWASPAQHAAMAALVPGARLEVIAGAGHMLPLEAPERLADLLVDFFFDGGPD